MHADWDFGPATSLVLGASAGALLLFGAGWLVATHPRWRRPVRDIPAEKVTRALLFRRFLHARLDPASATGLALTVALAVIFLAALAFGMLSDMIASHTGLARLDSGAAAWGARHATRQSTRVLGWLTLLGSTAVVSLLGAVAAVIDWARRHRVAAAGFLLTVIAGQNLIANGVKLLVRRDRPPVPHLAAATGYSFPSGHTASAAATYAALALLAGSGRHWRTRVWLWTAAAAVALAVASSRVLLGVHWLTDVLGGAALGLGWFAACSIAFGGRLLRFGAGAEQAAAEEAAEQAAAEEAAEQAAAGQPAGELAGEPAGEAAGQPGRVGGQGGRFGPGPPLR